MRDDNRKGFGGMCDEKREEPEGEQIGMRYIQPDVRTGGSNYGSWRGNWRLFGRWGEADRAAGRIDRAA